jgi:small subunit ribosomal protein S7
MAVVFNKWSTDGITIADAGLQRYITLDARYVPKTGARYAGRRFHKSKTFIVERLINKMMVTGHKARKHLRSSGHNTGKAALSYKIVQTAFEIVEKKTNKNPVEVFVKAVENGAPREEVISIEYGGARYPKAVDCAPQRRVDVVLRFLTQGACEKSFNKKKPVEEALADEILLAYNSDQGAVAIAKKLELERQADASR